MFWALGDERITCSVSGAQRLIWQGIQGAKNTREAGKRIATDRASEEERERGGPEVMGRLVGSRDKLEGARNRR